MSSTRDSRALESEDTRAAHGRDRLCRWTRRGRARARYGQALVRSGCVRGPSAACARRARFTLARERSAERPCRRRWSRLLAGLGGCEMNRIGILALASTMLVAVDAHAAEEPAKPKLLVVQT